VRSLKLHRGGSSGGGEQESVVLAFSRMVSHNRVGWRDTLASIDSKADCRGQNLRKAFSPAEFFA